MKVTLMWSALLAICVLSGSAYADLAWQSVSLDSVITGAVSYDASGDNVVVAGSAFTIGMGSTLSTQKIGGDGINNPVTGNFAVYAVFNYTDNAGVLAWAQANADTPLAIEVLAHTLSFDFNNDSLSDYDDYFALDGRDIPGYLTATFNELGAWGCTEIADGIWMDIAVAAASATNGQVAISVIFENMDFGSSDLNATILSGGLDGEIPGQWRASSFRVAAVPVPGAVLLAGIGFSAAGGCLRRRKQR